MYHTSMSLMPNYDEARMKEQGTKYTLSHDGLIWNNRFFSLLYKQK